MGVGVLGVHDPSIAELQLTTTSQADVKQLRRDLKDAVDRINAFFKGILTDERGFVTKHGCYPNGWGLGVSVGRPSAFKRPRSGSGLRIAPYEHRACAHSGIVYKLVGHRTHSC